MVRPEAVGPDHDHLARLDLALVLRVDQVECAGLGDHDPGVLHPSQDQRPESERIARGDQLVLRQEDHRVRAAHLRQGRDHAVDQGRTGGLRDQVDHHLGVRRGLEDRARRLEPVAQLDGVHQVAVVRHGERPALVLDHQRLRILEHGLAVRRVAVVPDRRGSDQAADDVWVEDVGDQPEAAVRDQGVAARRDDSGRLLSAVLQRIERQVGEVRRLGVAEHADHTALFMEAIRVGREHDRLSVEQLFERRIPGHPEFRHGDARETVEL